MPNLPLPEIPSVAPSRRRSLVRDACGCLQQQMFFWGCDARHPDGNLLVHSGFTKIPRVQSGGEGSSRYRKGWDGGAVELHSYCMGWYSHEQAGVVFVRNTGRFFACEPGDALVPGQYGERVQGRCADSLLGDVRPLIGMVVDYEKAVLSGLGPTYRESCWRHYQKMPGVRGWLPPARAVEWMELFLSDPGATPRAREWLREEVVV